MRHGRSATRRVTGIAVGLMELVLTALLVLPAGALEVDGVQPYALDQPKVPALLRPADGGQPLAAYSELMGRDLFAFECYLDTGSTRMILSRSDSQTLGVKSAGRQVEDWGISGTETFGVSRPYRLCVGDSSSDITNPDTFGLCGGYVVQLRQRDTDVLEAMPPNLTQSLTGGMQGMEDMFSISVNVVGTPFLKDHVAVLDPRPVAGALKALSGLMGGSGGQDSAAMLDALLKMAQMGSGGSGRIRVDLRERGESVEDTRLNVPLSMREVEEKDLPVSAANAPFVDGVVLRNGNRQTRASLLLDTGGAVTILSPDVAGKLGLDLENPELTAPIMGIGGGGGEVLKGFWIDGMRLPTREREGLSYRRVPVFVADLRELDGTIGINMLTPSVYLDMDMDKIARNPLSIFASMKTGPVPFRRIVVDLPGGRLGLEPGQAKSE